MQVSAIALGGMEQAAARLDRTATRLAKVADPTDTVDLSAEMVALMQARNDFAVNAKVLKTADEMSKTLVEMLG